MPPVSAFLALHVSLQRKKMLSTIIAPVTMNRFPSLLVFARIDAKRERSHTEFPPRFYQYEEAGSIARFLPVFRGGFFMM